MVEVPRIPPNLNDEGLELLVLHEIANHQPSELDQIVFFNHLDLYHTSPVASPSNNKEGGNGGMVLL